jgi:lysosomal acid lipase/cholesteryl ester hydrolase
VKDPDVDGWTTSEDERHFATTIDGWQLGLYRYRAQESPRPTPVLLGHGFAGSHWIFDLDESISLARFLAGRGFDVWLVDLRGRNQSWPTGGPNPDLQWTFDDFVFRDLPAAFEAVRELADANSLHWVGMETSGLAIYAAAISGLADGVTAAVTCGASVITPPEAVVPGVSVPLPAPEGTRVPFSMARHVGVELARRESELLESSFRPANTDWWITARYFTHGIPDEATAIVDQYRDWLENTTMRSTDHSTVWSDRLDEFTIPALVLVGAADRQRPPDAVEATANALGSPDKTFVRAGVATGFPVDFGHDDLLAGRDTPGSVFPLIADWLDAH